MHFNAPIELVPHDQPLIRWTHGNSKLPSSTMILSLPAGHTCPGARHCLTMVPREGGSARLGAYNTFACYAASQERYRKTVRSLRWQNYDILRGLDADEMVSQFATSYLKQARSYTKRLRFFESGDCFSQAMAFAIARFAQLIEPTIVYLYTKNLPVWIGLEIPANLRITASFGGRYDHLIAEHFPRNARVLHSMADADALGLPVDFDDSFAYMDQPVSFAHLVHGWQPAGSQAVAAINARRAAGEFTGYGSSSPHTIPSVPTPC